MFNLEKCSIALCVLILIFTILSISPIIFAQDETNDTKVTDISHNCSAHVKNKCK